MVFPVGDCELSAAGDAVGGVGVVRPLPTRLLHQLHLNHEVRVDIYFGVNHNQYDEIRAHQKIPLLNNLL